jgi:DNA-binding IclR family transcriptional regulator
MATSSYLVKPVAKALQVLDCLGQEEAALTLSEISRRVRLPKTTTYRYLCTLCVSGLVARDHDADLYRLGLRLLELGQKVGDQLQIRRQALPLMAQLRDRFNETVNLAVLDGTEVVYVEMVPSTFALRMQATLGGRDPAYTTALGKAILAHLPPEQWCAHLPQRLMRRTPKTITSLAALKADLLATRARGFARDAGENETGARCIGAPIFHRSGLAVAALSVSAPAARLDDSREAEVAPAMMHAARTISAHLGYPAKGGEHKL